MRDYFLLKCIVCLLLSSRIVICFLPELPGFFYLNATFVVSTWKGNATRPVLFIRFFTRRCIVEYLAWRHKIAFNKTPKDQKVETFLSFTTCSLHFCVGSGFCEINGSDGVLDLLYVIIIVFAWNVNYGPKTNSKWSPVFLNERYNETKKHGNHQIKILVIQNWRSLKIGLWSVITVIYTSFVSDRWIIVGYLVEDFLL